MNGKLTAAGPVKFQSSSSSRVGTVILEQTGNVFSEGISLNQTYVIMGKGHTVADTIGADTKITFQASGHFMAQPPTGGEDFTNPIDTSNASKTIYILTRGNPLYLKTDVDVSKASLQIGLGGCATVFLKNKVFGSNKISMERGVTVIESLDQLPDGGLSVSSGSFVFNRGVTWEMFRQRYGIVDTGLDPYYTIGTAACGGLGCRGQDLVIPADGSTNVMDRSIAFGSAQIYCNNWDHIGVAGRDASDGAVFVKAPSTLTAERTFAGSYATGTHPGLGGAYTGCTFHTIEGDLDGPGSVHFSAYSDADELHFAGHCTWTGSPSVGSLWGVGSKGTGVLNAGPGGMVLTGLANSRGIVAFDGPDSIPCGNDGKLAYLAFASRNKMDAAYLFAASSAGSRYTLPEGLKFCFNGDQDDTCYVGTFGEDGTSATIADADVLMLRCKDGDTATAGVMSRGKAMLTLGEKDHPVRFIPVYGLDAAASAEPTSVTDATAGIRSICLRGSGTIVLGNVEYTTLDHTGDTSDMFQWTLGSGCGAFRGAVRCKGTTDPHTTILNRPISLAGGVIELDDTDFSRTIVLNPTTADEFSWANGGGFAALGRDITLDVKRPDGTTDLNFGAGSNGSSKYGEPRSAGGMTFGSFTCDSTIILTNNINLQRAADVIYGIRAVRGTNPAKPAVRLTGALTGGGLSVHPGTLEDGTQTEPGIVEIASSASKLRAILVNAGRLRILEDPGYADGDTKLCSVTNGGILEVVGSTPNFNNGTRVFADSILSGTGTIKKKLNVYAGGIVQPGVTASGVMETDVPHSGTLTVSGPVTFQDGAVIRPGASDGAGLVSTGAITVSGKLVVDVSGVTSSRLLTLMKGTSVDLSASTGVEVRGDPDAKHTTYSLVAGDDGLLVLKRSRGGTVILLR